MSHPDAQHTPPLRVMGLHSLNYCERLFYLEEVEQIQVADAAVYAGRKLHLTLERESESEGTMEELHLHSELLGLQGKVDALRRRDGQLIAYEHKRGRCMRGEQKQAEAWPSDRIQLGAYAMMLEQSSGAPVPEGRIRYHADGLTVRVPIDEALRAEVQRSIERARELMMQSERPPVAQNERLCARCSLAPVCLPEEERLAQSPEHELPRIAPADDERDAVHITGHGTRISRSGNELVAIALDGAKTSLPTHDIKHVLIHGSPQITTQALHLCADKNIAVSWLSAAGRMIGSLSSGAGQIQRKLRQYKALSDQSQKLELAKRLVMAKISGQLRFVLRATRKKERSEDLTRIVEGMRRGLEQSAHATDSAQLLGHEGASAAQYFSAWQYLIDPRIDERLHYTSRTRRPPRDRLSALMGYGYALLLADVNAAILAVGLEPALGFYHTPRSAAPPLALDMMELFRVPLMDMPLMASINRGQWNADEDFVVTEPKIWLSDAGKKKMIEVYERRKAESWKHSVVGYSLSYARLLELETRLLEKEWTGAPGLFAKFRLR